MLHSLRIRVAAFLLVPMAGLAVVLAVGGTWFIDAFVTHAYDRVLAGSVLSIAERLTVQDDTVALDMPAAALGMLSNSEHDSIYYSITDNGALVTGYPDLPLPDTLPSPETITYRDAVYRGQRVRVGMMLKPIYVTRHAALVQVAETTVGRDLLARRMLTALAALGATLAGIGSLLVWFAVRMGLTPLDRLRREVERRHLQSPGPVSAFSVSGVPSEAVPLVTALNDLLERVNGAMAVLRRFTADASHQLRTPVAILKTHLALLDRQPPGSPPWRRSRADIDEAVDRLDRLIAQLLTLAGLEEDAARATARIRVDLVALARETTLACADLARRGDVDLSFDGPDRPLDALAAPLLLEEVLRNLIDNAVRYNRPGGSVAVRVYAGTGPDGAAQACIAVEDDGPGIPEDQRALVFARFHRIARSGDPGGSGLGLAIVRSFLDRIGGGVALSDGPGGRGLRAVITLAAPPVCDTAAP